MPSEEPAPPRRWLSIVGIGEGGIDGLTGNARAAVSDAEFVFGGRRHLALVAGLVRGEARPWPSPFDVAAVAALAGRRVCVVASGDPFLHGVGATLARLVPAGEMAVFPAPSAFSHAAARLGWPIADTALLSLHGRPVALVRPHLDPGRRILALTSDADGPAAVAALLAAAGFGASRLTVLEALGGPRERIRAATAEGFALSDVDPLNVLAIEVATAPEARVIPRAPGLPDAWFDNDGQLTKREIRAMTLSALAPRRGEHLWDVGAGAGSIAIEWMLADPSLTAVALEARADRAARVRANAVALGVPGLAVVEGAAPAALAGLLDAGGGRTPDAVFVGGGASEAGVLETAAAALAPGGRLVVNAVTLETEAVLLARHAALGGDLVRLAVARAAPVAGMTGWRPAMPVTQWTWRKP